MTFLFQSVQVPTMDSKTEEVLEEEISKTSNNQTSIKIQAIQEAHVYETTVTLVRRVIAKSSQTPQLIPTNLVLQALDIKLQIFAIRNSTIGLSFGHQNLMSVFPLATHHPQNPLASCMRQTGLVSEDLNSRANGRAFWVAGLTGEILFVPAHDVVDHGEMFGAVLFDLPNRNNLFGADVEFHGESHQGT